MAVQEFSNVRTTSIKDMTEKHEKVYGKRASKDSRIKPQVYPRKGSSRRHHPRGGRRGSVKSMVISPGQEQGLLYQTGRKGLREHRACCFCLLCIASHCFWLTVPNVCLETHFFPFCVVLVEVLIRGVGM